MQFVKGAALMCSRPSFQRYLSTLSGYNVTSTENAASALRDLLDIKSRRELATNAAARSRYQSLIASFNAWANAQGAA